MNREEIEEIAVRAEMCIEATLPGQQLRALCEAALANQEPLTKGGMSFAAITFVAVKKWRDGGETVVEYFATRPACLEWIDRQPQPKTDEWEWCVDEYY